MNKSFKKVINIIRWIFSILFLFVLLGIIVEGFKGEGDTIGFIILFFILILIFPPTYKQIKKLYFYLIYKKDLKKHRKKMKIKKGYLITFLIIGLFIFSLVMFSYSVLSGLLILTVIVIILIMVKTARERRIEDEEEKERLS